MGLALRYHLRSNSGSNGPIAKECHRFLVAGPFKFRRWPMVAGSARDLLEQQEDGESVQESTASTEPSASDFQETDSRPARNDFPAGQDQKANRYRLRFRDSCPEEPCVNLIEKSVENRILQGCVLSALWFACETARYVLPDRGSPRCRVPPISRVLGEKWGSCESYISRRCPQTLVPLLAQRMREKWGTRPILKLRENPISHSSHYRGGRLDLQLHRAIFVLARIDARLGFQHSQRLPFFLWNAQMDVADAVFLDD
jgi:hypothetical protein